MRFDVHLRAGIRQRLDELAGRMRDWEAQPRLGEDELAKARETIQPFGHATTYRPLVIGGVDGTGDFPSVAYGDSFVYTTLAQATRYAADPVSGLRELAPVPPPVVEFVWIPEESDQRVAVLDAAFAALAGKDVDRVIAASDYRLLKANMSGGANTVESQRETLIRPHAADAGNLAVQLRSTAELGAALRLILDAEPLDYVLVDGTLSLPFVGRKESSLFYEHLKRLCCVQARARRIAFVAISKSHGLPSIELLEELARERLGFEAGRVAEHWYLRVPEPAIDGWEFSLTEGRRVPPPGAMTYLVRFHRATPVLRLDIDRQFWCERIKGDTEALTRANERGLFEDLDYTGHDQRCYGYPYPIKAGHDRASLTEAERVALRKQIVDAAVRAGMRRSLFREAALATGHE
jgi:hypothetical protein